NMIDLEGADIRRSVTTSFAPTLCEKEQWLCVVNDFWADSISWSSKLGVECRGLNGTFTDFVAGMGADITSHVLLKRSNGVVVNSYVLVATSSGTDFRVFEKFLGFENVWSYIVVIEFDWNGDSWPMKNGVNCVVVESIQGESQLNNSDSSLSMVEEEGPEADTKRVHELLHNEDKSPLSFVSCYNDGLLAVNLQSILGLKDAEKERRVFEKRASEFISEILLDNLFLEDLIGNEISNADELHQLRTLDTNVITFCSKRMLIGSYHTSADKSVTSSLTSTVEWGLIDLINLQLARVGPGKPLQLMFVIRLETEGTYFRIQRVRERESKLWSQDVSLYTPKRGVVHGELNGEILVSFKKVPEFKT
ncbi:hypothetical protein Tco_1434924, partial [Tanacetum coccineum]